MDAHELLALVAPRPTFVSYVFRLLGARDLGVAEDCRVAKQPAVNAGLLDGRSICSEEDS